jgi:hypothetical protein
LSKQRKIGTMTTRAGLTGLLTGLMTTIMVYPLFLTWSDAYLYARPGYIWIVAVFSVLLVMGGGFWAARWSGSTLPIRCAALGGLAGGLAGAIVFCLWGSAAAGLNRTMLPLGPTINETICPYTQFETIGTIIQLTLGTFLALFLGGSGFGAVGGWLACPRQHIQLDVFDKSGPQMALNASITAVPASIVAAALAAAIFSRLADMLVRQTSQSICVRTIMDMPLAVSLLLVLISHLALTLVIPHEARQAEHLCGMDEVKMAAYVGIGASPALILLLFLINADFFSNPLVIIALLAITGLSLKSLHSLFKLILPRRASFPQPEDGWQKTEANLFGTIANSSSPQLVLLCMGCGWVMILPLYASVISVLINLTSVLASSAFLPFSEYAQGLFLAQALVSMGLVTISIVVLTTIYLFYRKLGRWFSKWNSGRSN